MAVNGLDLFAERFKEYSDEYILIGGAACDLWFSEKGMHFRKTKDLDIVLILDRLTPDFISGFRKFISDGNYEYIYRNEDDPPILYRFEKPGMDDFPYMIELFCKSAEGLDVAEEQHIIPVHLENAQSLSAILLNESYYKYLMDHCRYSRGVQHADCSSLIPLKMRAWLDLTARKDDGETVKGDDIKKHRNDVFRLAATLPETPGDPLPTEILSDVKAFIQIFRPESSDWGAIQHSIRQTIGGNIPAATLIAAIMNFYQIN